MNKNEKGIQLYYRIDQLAKKNKTSVKAVARDAGFRSSNAIYNYKRGAFPNDTSLKAIAKVLKTTPEYLKGETDDPSPTNKSGNDTITTADLASPVLAYDGRPLTGQTAEEIRNFAAYLLQKEKAEEEKNNGAEKST